MKAKWFHVLWLLSIILAVSVVHAQETAPLRILFIGNSITYTNKMPDWVMELSKNLGAIPPVVVEDQAFSDARFRDQLKYQSSTSPLGVIRKGGWSFVVLQGQYDEPVEMPEEFFASGSRLAEEVRSVGGEPLFFQTYSPAEGTFMYTQKAFAWSGGSPGEMHARVSKAYTFLANQTKARVIPVGDVWHWVLAQHSEIRLYEDFIHPTACGSYLVACVFVAAITGKDPRAATWLPPAGVTEAEARVLREAAATMSLGKEEDKAQRGAQAVVLPKDDPLFGTWVSEERDKSEREVFSGRFVISPDLHELDYRHISDTKPFGEGWLTPEKTWVDEAGNHWYKLRSIGWVYPSGAGKIEGFYLCRISSDGETIESVWMESGYPDDVTPLGPDYSIYYRQK